MKNYVRCKVCGYIMEAKDLKEVCPVCGVPKTAFVEYKYTISEKRQNILKQHLHPISVHFPEAIAVFLIGFLLLSFITPEDISNDLLIVNKTLSIFFPLTVLIACMAGVYDGKIRFKKLSPPYLKLKIYLGAALFVGSILVLILFFLAPYTFLVKLALFIISLVNVGLCVILGKMGGTMIGSVMPG